MKKVFIMSAVAALIAACSSAPKVTESATNLEKLNKWVDSIKTLAADTAKSADSATWAGWNTEFEGVVGTIKAEELDATQATTLEAVKTAWTTAGASYSERIAAAKAAAAAVVDTTAAAVNAAPAAATEAGKTVIEKAVDAGKAGLDKAGKTAEKKMTK